MSYDGRIVFRHLDGSIELYGPGSPDTFVKGETETEFWQRIHDQTKAAVPRLATAQWVATIPATEHLNKDRYFRKAWTWTTPEPVIDIDMPKALEIVRDNIRQARVPRFTTLDSEFMRALEDNDLARQAQIKAQKTILRNAPADPRLDNVTDAAALKNARDAIISEMG